MKWLPFAIFIIFIYVIIITFTHLLDKFPKFKYVVLVAVIAGIAACFIYKGNKPQDPLNNPKNNPYFKCEYDSTIKTTK